MLLQACRPVATSLIRQSLSAAALSLTLGAWSVAHAAAPVSAAPAAAAPAAVSSPPADTKPKKSSHKAAHQKNADNAQSTVGGLQQTAVGPAWDAQLDDPSELPQLSLSDTVRMAAEAAQVAAEAARVTAESVRALTAHVAENETEIPVDPPKLPEWAYQLSLSALMNTGNSTSFSGKAAIGVDGNWHDWSLEVRGNAAYAQNSPLGTTDLPTVFNSGLTARGTHFFTPFIGMYALGSVAQDRVASIRMQAFGDLGVSLIWWETERDDYIHSRLRTSVGFRALHEERHQYYPTEGVEQSRMIYGPPISLSFRYGITKYAYFTEDFDVTPDVTSQADTRATSTSVLSAQVTQRTGLQLAFKVRYIGQPAPGKNTTDTELSAGINFSF